jgi:TRAP transporter TAXI family solute receptor
MNQYYIEVGGAKMLLKKCVTGVLALLVILSSLSLACAPKSPVEKVRLKIGAPPAGTPAYIMAEALGEAIRRGNPDYDAIVLSGGTATNLERFRRGEIDMHAGGTSRGADWDLLRLSDPEAQPVEGNSISAMGSQTIQYVIDAKLGITSMADLVAKKPALKLVVGRKGSTPYLHNVKTFQAHGIELEDIEAWGGKLHYETGDKAWSLFEDGFVDGRFLGGPVPVPHVFQVKKPIAILTLTKEAIENLAREGHRPAVIPAGTYPWLEEDIPTVSTAVTVKCRPGMPEEIAYNIAKAAVEQKDYLTSVHTEFEGLITPEMIAYIDTLYPLHPGARKYYQEIGWIE